MLRICARSGGEGGIWVSEAAVYVGMLHEAGLETTVYEGLVLTGET